MHRIGLPDGDHAQVEFSPDLYEWPAAAMQKDSAWVRCNMVMSQDGAIVGSDERAGSIATPIDKTVFGALRRDCDVILVGAGTARAESYRPASVPVALVSRHLAIPHDLPLFAQHKADSPATFALTTQKAIDSAPDWLRSGAELIACGDEDVDLAQALDALSQRGLTRVHCEGGPHLLTDLIRAELLDELLLTVSPLIQGATKSLIGSLETPVKGAFTQVLVEDGTLFLRFLPDYR